eukprot:364822-Chlamydomonas_euryale.AAC.16
MPYEPAVCARAHRHVAACMQMPPLHHDMSPMSMHADAAPPPHHLPPQRPCMHMPLPSPPASIPLSP